MLVIDSITAQTTKDYEAYHFPVEQAFYFPISSAQDFISTGSSDHDEFVSEVDGDPVVRTYNNFTINKGHLVRPTNRCKGLYLNILGDCIINGTLSMTARGAHAVGKYVGIHCSSIPKIYFNETNIFIDKIPFILKDGGGAGTAAGESGKIAQNGISCGGGGAGAQATGGSSAGSAGTSFSGGSGGGSRNRARMSSESASYGQTYSVAQPNGGRGGYSLNRYTTGAPQGGGAGNPGSGGRGYAGTGGTGTGGLIILIVHGKLTIGSTGLIVSNGANGGLGNSGEASGGGSSGGGCIDIYHKGIIKNNGTISANGGASVYQGGAGGAGSIRITNFYQIKGNKYGNFT